jgi:hypothetical protein
VEGGGESSQDSHLSRCGAKAVAGAGSSSDAWSEGGDSVGMRGEEGDEDSAGSSLVPEGQDSSGEGDSGDAGDAEGRQGRRTPTSRRSGAVEAGGKVKATGVNKFYWNYDMVSFTLCRQDYRKGKGFRSMYLSGHEAQGSGGAVQGAGLAASGRICGRRGDGGAVQGEVEYTCDAPRAGTGKERLDGGRGETLRFVSHQDVQPW